MNRGEVVSVVEVTTVYGLNTPWLGDEPVIIMPTNRLTVEGESNGNVTVFRLADGLRVTLPPRLLKRGVSPTWNL